MKVVALLAAVLAALAAVPAAAAWTWPTDGPVLRAFALGADPYAGGQHRGIDVGGAAGAAIRAPAAGLVSYAGTLPRYGRTVTIRTADGYAVTLLHLGPLDVVKGAVVSEGQAVAAIGPSGDVDHDVPYVQLGIRLAADEHGYVDPLSLLPARPALEAPAPPAPAPAPAFPASASVPAGGSAEPPPPVAAPAAAPAADPTPAPSSPAAGDPPPVDDAVPVAEPVLVRPAPAADPDRPLMTDERSPVRPRDAVPTSARRPMKAPPTRPAAAAHPRPAAARPVARARPAGIHPVGERPAAPVPLLHVHTGATQPRAVTPPPDARAAVSGQPARHGRRVLLALGVAALAALAVIAAAALGRRRFRAVAARRLAVVTPCAVRPCPLGRRAVDRAPCRSRPSVGRACHPAFTSRPLPPRRRPRTPAVA
jgi:hypothetical protein